MEHLDASYTVVQTTTTLVAMLVSIVATAIALRSLRVARVAAQLMQESVDLSHKDRTDALAERLTLIIAVADDLRRTLLSYWVPFLCESRTDVPSHHIIGNCQRSFARHLEDALRLRVAARHVGISCSLYSDQLVGNLRRILFALDQALRFESDEVDSVKRPVPVLWEVSLRMIVSSLYKAVHILEGLESSLPHDATIPTQEEREALLQEIVGGLEAVAHEAWSHFCGISTKGAA